MAKVKKVPAKRETKGKQHALRSASLDRIADDVSKSPEAYVKEYLVEALRKEAKYLRSILR